MLYDRTRRKPNFDRYFLFKRCKAIIDQDGKPKELTDDEKNQLKSDIIEKMANDGLRTICIAYKDLGNEKQNWDNEENVVNDLTCICIVISLSGIYSIPSFTPLALQNCKIQNIVCKHPR